MRDLAGRIALVTGASHGFGTYIARALAAERMHLVLAARSAAELDSLAAELRKTGVDALPVPTNLADTGAIERLVTAAHIQFGAVDVLVNNAGVLVPKTFHHHAAGELEHHVRVNLVAPLVLTSLVLPGMLERRRGHIVNLGSLAGKAPPGFVEPYAATKAALIAFAASLRASYRRKGVSASAVIPGFVTEAGMYQTLQETTHLSAPRWVGTSRPEDVARAVVRAIKRALPEVIVNPGPMRLLMALRELFPRLSERLGVDTFERAAGVYERGTALLAGTSGQEIMEASVKVGRVLETCLYAADLQAAERFYTTVLGLEAFAAEQGRHVFFRSGGGVFLVFNPAETARAAGETPPHGARGPGHVAFAVAERELAAWRERLARHRVAIEADVTWPGGGRSLYIRDPAGNSIELTTPRIWGLPGESPSPG